jgi:hypothetical protein
MTGEWLSIHNKLSNADSFLWGHQGYEYVDLGRVWQLLLFIGLLLWLFLVVRSVRPALNQVGDQRQLLWLFIMSLACRPDADLGFGQPRLLVRPQLRISGFDDYAEFPPDACPR